MVFVFLSIDKDAEQWKKGAKRHGLLLNSYRVKVNNHFRSEMIDKLALQSTPRYLIFDKKGALVHKNAPGTGSSEVKNLLDYYLEDPSPTALAK